MVPAISEDSHARGILTALGNFAGTTGWNGLAIVVVPITTYFTFIATGKHTQGPQGWLALPLLSYCGSHFRTICRLWNQ